jgi:hypothetical protein
MARGRYYPNSPGWKDAGVSRDNALAGKVRFTRMQNVVLALYEQGFEGTADDAAEKLRITPFSCRPRCTELVAMGALERLRVDRSMPGRSAWILKLAATPPAQKKFRSGSRAPTRTATSDSITDLFDDGQPDERQEWHDYDPDC